MDRETFKAKEKVWFSNFVGIKTAAVVIGPASDSTGDVMVELQGSSYPEGRRIRQARISQLSKRTK